MHYRVVVDKVGPETWVIRAVAEPCGHDRIHGRIHENADGSCMVSVGLSGCVRRANLGSAISWVEGFVACAMRGASCDGTNEGGAQAGMPVASRHLDATF